MFSMVIPVAVVETSVLASTSVALSESAWLVGTTYADEAIVRRALNGLQHRFESQQAGNVGVDPATDDDASHWLDLGPVNAHAMFDDTTTTVTSDANEIEVVIEVPATQRAGTIYLAGLSAESVRIHVEDPLAGPVHDETYSLADVGAVTNLWLYFTAQVLRKSEILVSDLPNGAGSTITVTISHPGETAVCGHLHLGEPLPLGVTRWGAKTEIKDYTRFVENGFGDRVVVEGNYRKLFNGQILIENRVKDAAERELTRARGQPRLYIADEDFISEVVFGICRWGNEMSLPPDYSEMSVQVEGNT